MVMIEGIPDIITDLGVLGIITRLFNKEIDYWVTAISAYYKRPYDVDRNPKTHDWCKLYNPGTGMWDTVSLTFRLLPRKDGNGVFVHYYDFNSKPWKLSHTQRVPFLEWKSKEKARIPMDEIKNLPVNKVN